MTKTSVFGLNEKAAGTLAYALFFLSGIVVLVMERENRTVRFHALQSIIWFAVLFVAGIIVRYIPLIGGLANWLLGLVWLASWLGLMFCAFSGIKFKIPIIGDVVQAQVNK